MSAQIFHDGGGMSIQARDVELHLWETLEPVPPGNERLIYMHKGRQFLSAMAAIVDAIKPKRAVEVGVYYGASAIYWTERYALERLAAIELAPGAPHLQKYIERHQLADVIRPHFGVSQDDGATIRQAMAQDFGNSHVDFIVDDASHFYAQTRATLEILLPFVRTGGVYIIEDWQWGHEADWPPGLWNDFPLLSPLLSELMLICARGVGVIDRIEIHPNFAVLWRGAAALPTDGSFRLTDHYTARGFSVSLPPSVAAL